MEVQFKMSKFLIVICLTCPLLQLASAVGETCRTPDSKDGVCISIRSCKALLNLLETQGTRAADFLRASLCSYQNAEPVVCCPQSSGDADKSRKTKEIQNTPYGPLQPPHCGFSNASHFRVVGGIPAQLDAWPWLAALGYKDQKNPLRTKWLCGGSLISSRHILTAAHCVHGRKDLYKVRLGDLVLDDDNDGAHPIDVLIEKQTTHPQYSTVNYVNDIAVLRLKEDVPFTLQIHPICLPVSEELRSFNFERKFPFIAGWGSVEYKGPTSNVLREVQLPVVSTDSCKTSFARFKNVVIDDRILCAGYVQGGKDACQGDSGGPLMYPLQTDFYVIGVVSFGFQCAQPNYPGVYTRVTEFLPFITEQLV